MFRKSRTTSIPESAGAPERAPKMDWASRVLAETSALQEKTSAKLLNVENLLIDRDRKLSDLKTKREKRVMSAASQLCIILKQLPEQVFITDEMPYDLLRWKRPVYNKPYLLEHRLGFITVQKAKEGEATDRGIGYFKNGGLYGDWDILFSTHEGGRILAQPFNEPNDPQIITTSSIYTTEDIVNTGKHEQTLHTMLGMAMTLVNIEPDLLPKIVTPPIKNWYERE